MIGGKFAPLTIITNEDADIDSMITIFSTAVTEQPVTSLANIVKRNKTNNNNKKHTWITAEIVDLCDNRRELRKNRFELEGSEKYKEENNNIKRCMKKAKKNKKTG